MKFVVTSIKWVTAVEDYEDTCRHYDAPATYIRCTVLCKTYVTCGAILLRWKSMSGVIYIKCIINQFHPLSL